MKKQSLYRKQKRNNRKLIIITASIISIAAIVTAGFLLWQNTTQPKITNENKPLFTLDNVKAENWWTSGSSWPADQDNTQQEDSPPLPIVSILAFQGVEKPGDRLDQCFVSASYNAGSIDVDTALQAKEDGMLQGRGNSASLNKIGESLQVIKTSKGEKQYTLHQYDLVPAAGEDYQRGNEFGYITLQDGYIYIFGVCPTADMLDSTIPALSALEFKL